MKPVRFLACAILPPLAFASACTRPTSAPLDPVADPEHVVLDWEDVHGDYSELRLEVSWDPVDDAAGYRVRIYPADAYSITNDLDQAPRPEDVDLDVTGPSATLQPFAPGERFAYRVGAMREDGVFFSGARVSITEAPIVPDAPLTSCMLSSRAALALRWQTEGRDGEPTYADLSRIQCNGEGVSDLSRIGVAPELSSLVLSDNAIEDLAPLSALTELESLAIDGNPSVASLGALSELDELRSVTLGGHPSLLDLRGLPTGLRSLSMAGDVPIDGLERLTGLETLAISGRALDDLTLVEGLDALTALSLVDAGLTDVTPLLSREGLGFVSLAGNDAIPCSQLDALAAHLGSEATLVRPATCAE